MVDARAGGNGSRSIATRRDEEAEAFGVTADEPPAIASCESGTEQAERQQAERGGLGCRGLGSDLKREAARVHPAAPRPYIRARRDAEAHKGRVVPGQRAHEGHAGDVVPRHINAAAEAGDADEHSAAATGKGLAPAPEIRRPG